MRTARAGGAGGTAMPGAGELVDALRRAGHAVLICTNASQKPPREYAAHLRSAGIDVPDADFVTAGSAAADYIAAHHPGARVLVVGEDGLADPMRGAGLQLADPGTKALADVVVVGAANNYSNELLNAACLAVDAGAPLYTTVNVPWFHGGLGKSIAVSGTIAAAIGWTTGTVAQVLGKPSAALGETLLHRLGTPTGQVTVVGDATAEIELARSMGAHSALVLSGATSPELLATLDGAARPDLAVADVAALLKFLTPSLSQSQGARS
jgi:HAD superfamily hydrolase (TIGR01450 family)